MKRPTAIRLLPKAASAALAVLSMTANASAEQTIPAIPDDNCAFEKVERAFRDNLPESPILMDDFISEFPASLHTPEVKLMRADYYFFRKEYPLALGYYNDLPVNAFSGDTRETMLYRKAYCLVKTGYYSEARTLFSQLTGSDRYRNPSRFYLAYIKYVNGNLDEAYDEFTALKKGGYNDPEIDYYLNQIDYSRGDYHKVAHAADRLLVGDIPEELLPETMRVAGLSHYKLGDKTTARNILSRYADMMGGGAEITALYTLGTIRYDDGNYQEALPLFGTVTDHDDGALGQSAWLYIGQINSKNGDVQAAAMAFDKAARRSFDLGVAEAASYNRAVASTDGTSVPFTDAARVMEEFIESHPASPYSASLSRYLANSYYGQRNYAEALRQLDRISRPDAQTKAMRQKILYQLGVTQLQQDKLTDAIANLKEASAPTGPDKEVAAQAALWLGDAYYARKDYQAAAKAYEQAISSGQTGINTSLAQYNLGYTYMKLKNYPKAEAAFTKAEGTKGLTPQQLADARLRHADCLYYNGKYSEALSLFRNIKIEGGQNGAFAEIRMADILGRQGNISEKITILERVSENPDAGIWRSTALTRLADAYSEKGDDRKAAEIYARILNSAEKNTDNSQTYYSLATNAENLYNAGDLKGALEAYRLLENSGIDALYPAALQGIMRSSTDRAEIVRYATKVSELPGLSAEESNEALYLIAQANLEQGGDSRIKGENILRNLAASSDRYWGSRAALRLAESLLSEGVPAEAESVLLKMIDDGSEDPYWMARGYITLSDAYAAQGKNYLARLYLETLQSNYPGSEKEISDMISQRLKKLKK